MLHSFLASHAGMLKGSSWKNLLGLDAKLIVFRSRSGVVCFLLSFQQSCFVSFVSC